MIVKQLPGYGPETPVPIFQWAQEFEPVLELYRRLAPRTVLEVGTYHGGTLYHWLQNAVAPAHIVAMDSYAVGVDNRHLYAGWQPEGVDLTVIQGDSRDPAIVEAAAARGPYDWIFIDAGHYYHEVKADWENYRPLAAEKSVVLFHDILPPSPNHPEIEVERLWNEIRAQHMTLEVVRDRGADWGGIGIVLL